MIERKIIDLSTVYSCDMNKGFNLSIRTDRSYRRRKRFDWMVIVNIKSLALMVS
jgi:hypothetical protein